MGLRARRRDIGGAQTISAQEFSDVIGFFLRPVAGVREVGPGIKGFSKEIFQPIFA